MGFQQVTGYIAIFSNQDFLHNDLPEGAGTHKPQTEAAIIETLKYESQNN
ncbi:MAG: hypothetical protein JNM09_12215 [Blastocatellia bacterium]|nr:hypothetical protein [Blastocatellia bacterium]